MGCVREPDAVRCISVPVPVRDKLGGLQQEGEMMIESEVLAV